MINVKNAIQAVSADYAAFSSKGSTGECWKLSLTLQNLESSLREYIQESSRPEIASIIGKLESGTPLNEKDKEYLRLWIVGDADTYLALENDFHGWTAELERLMVEIGQADPAKTDFSSLSALRARALDAVRVLGDILFFLQQKERVASFVESTQQIDPDEADLLIQILKGKTRSSEN